MAPYEDQITTRDVTPDDFGRIAAQTAKQVILQRIREAERHMMFEEYQDRVGELITGIIQQSDNRYTLVQLRERVEALLPRSEQVWNERYDHGMRVKAVITEVNAEGKGPGIVVSRRNPELIKELFELEVPEIADDLVEIVGVAREPGYRSKIAVISHADGVDPVGACVGPRGSRVRMVVSELRGEKIDIIPYNEEPARFVAKALSPARVREVLVDDEKQEATVIVPDDQLSLAIGREGQNARLAAKLTGWKVDIKSETEFSQEEEELTYEDGEERRRPLRRGPLGRAPVPERFAPGLALLRPSAAPGARRFETNQVTVLSALSDAEVSVLADPNADEAEVRPLVERATAAFEAQQARARSPPRPRRPRRSSRRPRSRPRPTSRRPSRSSRRPRRRRPRRPSADEASRRRGGHRGGIRRGVDRRGGRGPTPTPRAEAASEADGAAHGESEPIRGTQGRGRGFRGEPSRGCLRSASMRSRRQQGLSSKEVLAALNAAGIEAKVAASSVEEADALKALQAQAPTVPPPRRSPPRRPRRPAARRRRHRSGSDSAPSKSAQPGAEARRGAGAAPPLAAGPAAASAGGS